MTLLTAINLGYNNPDIDLSDYVTSCAETDAIILGTILKNNDKPCPSVLPEPSNSVWTLADDIKAVLICNGRQYSLMYFNGTPEAVILAA